MNGWIEILINANYDTIILYVCWTCHIIGCVFDNKTSVIRITINHNLFSCIHSRTKSKILHWSWSFLRVKKIKLEMRRTHTHTHTQTVTLLLTEQVHMNMKCFNNRRCSNHELELIINATPTDRCTNGFKFLILDIEITWTLLVRFINEDYLNRESQCEIHLGIPIVGSLPQDFTPLCLN